MSEPAVPESLYLFGCGVSGPRGATAEVVGNKAVSLIRMAAAGLPIPPGFVLPTTLCLRYLQGGCRLPEDTGRAPLRGYQGRSRRRPVCPSAATGIPCWSPCARGHRSRCRGC